MEVGAVAPNLAADNTWKQYQTEIRACLQHSLFEAKYGKTSLDHKQHLNALSNIIPLMQPTSAN